MAFLVSRRQATVVTVLPVLGIAGTLLPRRKLIFTQSTKRPFSLLAWRILKIRLLMAKAGKETW